MPALSDTLRAKVKASEMEAIKEMEDSIYMDSLEVVEGVQSFWKVDAKDACNEDPPDSWVDEYGAERAIKMWRLAKAGNLTKQEAPMGIHAALAHAQSVMRSRSSEQAGGKTLNIGTMVNMPPLAQLYPEREVDTDD